MSFTQEEDTQENFRFFEDLCKDMNIKISKLNKIMITQMPSLKELREVVKEIKLLSEGMDETLAECDG